jgi:sugar phosphate isomerase/epimerase
MKISASVTDTPGPFAPMLFSGDLPGCLDRAAAMGYDAVELFILDPRETGIDWIARQVDSRGLSVNALGPGLACFKNGWSFAHPDPEVRKLALDRVFDHIRLAAHWGASIDVGGIRAKLSDDPELSRQQRLWVVECLQSCAKFAAPLGVSLAIEPLNRYETNFINTVSEALELLDLLDCPNTGLLLDSFHMNIEEPSIYDAIDAARGRILNIHLPDSNRQAPGRGHLDLAKIVAKLREVGYDHYLSMELLPIPSSDEAAQQALQYTRRLLAGLS